MPIVFGAFFTQLDNMAPNVSADWAAIGAANETTVQYLVPLMPALGIVIIIIKVLMTASARGRD